MVTEDTALPHWKKAMDNIDVIGNPIPSLRKSRQPPLSSPGAAPDSDRARKPRLAEPAATNQELSPGDRVEGLGNFGIPTGRLGTIERVNEDEALVKWDDDSRMRLGQPWLKKVQPVTSPSRL